MDDISEDRKGVPLSGSCNVFHAGDGNDSRF